MTKLKRILMASARFDRLGYHKLSDKVDAALIRIAQMGGMPGGMPDPMGGMGGGMPDPMGGMGGGMPDPMGGMGGGMPDPMGGMGGGMPGGMPDPMGGMGGDPTAGLSDSGSATEEQAKFLYKHLDNLAGRVKELEDQIGSEAGAPDKDRPLSVPDGSEFDESNPNGPTVNIPSAGISMNIE
jgi:hypothetical protein